MAPIRAVVAALTAALLLGVATAAAEALPPPPVVKGLPAAGRRVRVVPPEHSGSDVHHTLYLPADWSPARRDAGELWPVIMEYSGNVHPPSGSEGTVEGSVLGYGLTQGEAIWAVLPFVAGAAGFHGAKPRTIIRGPVLHHVVLEPHP